MKPDTVIGAPVRVSSMGLQYCPELRIPLNRATAITGRMPDLAGAAVPVASGYAGLAIFAWGVFMFLFLFTFVNTQYEAGRIIYPDFASGFAAIFFIFLPEWYHK
jgi:hypothetical protein